MPSRELEGRIGPTDEGGFAVSTRLPRTAQRGWDSVDDPTIIDPTDVIVRVDTTTICGTDLHILKGDVPETTPGTVLGHRAWAWSRRWVPE